MSALRLAEASPDALAPLLCAIPSLPRAMLARLTERMIERLDELDGDIDREPEDDCCEAGDDGCGPILINGRILWGADNDAL